MRNNMDDALNIDNRCPRDVILHVNKTQGGYAYDDRHVNSRHVVHQSLYNQGIPQRAKQLHE